MRGVASGSGSSSVTLKPSNKRRVTVTNFVSNNTTAAALRYNEQSFVTNSQDITITNNRNETSRVIINNNNESSNYKNICNNNNNINNNNNKNIKNKIITTTTENRMGTGDVALAATSRMSPPTSMDTSEVPHSMVAGGGPGLALVKAETPEHMAGTSIGPTAASTVVLPVGPGNALFAGIASSNKRPRPDDWLAPNGPSSPQALTSQQLVYTTPQQQLGQIPLSQQNQQQQQTLNQTTQQQLQQEQQQQQQQQPMTLTTNIVQPQQQQQQQQPPNGNGYVSPMSAGSYDPYSPNEKIIGRDDLSPPNSLNGYSADSCDAKKKKGPTPRQQEELCLVCGDRASGYHYNALTCEGCKGFFRRSITKNAVYQCKYGSNCEIDMYMRRKCQECRLKKCVQVGMRPECVVPEYQCAVKRKEKKAQKEKDKPNSTTMNGSSRSMSIDSVGVKIEPSEAECLPMSGGGSSSSSGIIPSISSTKPVTPEQEELIHRLVYFQNVYEHPSEEDLARIMYYQPAEGEDPSDAGFRHITEITILTVQLIVEFAKSLSGFDKLLREDQIALLKACSSEVMMLRMARKYDVQTDSIVFANNQPYTKDSYSLAGMGDTIEDLLGFCRYMYNMKVNNAEYALLTAIVIFSERPNLLEGWKVEKIQEIYLEALKAYVDNRRKPRSGTVFAKLLAVLTELRTLGNQNSELCISLKLKNKKLPPFLAEIWDVMP